MASLDPTKVLLWTVEHVNEWLRQHGLESHASIFLEHRIDGLALLMLTEDDIKNELKVKLLGEVKRIYAAILQLQEDSLDQNVLTVPVGGPSRHSRPPRHAPLHSPIARNRLTPSFHPNRRNRTYSSDSQGESADGVSPCRAPGDSPHSPMYDVSWAKRGVATNLRPEYLKTTISGLYMLLVTWVTAIIMVFVHDRVPDKDRHPPLPDIFLDNVPHIPWAFQLCEITIVFLALTWLVILFFHKHRSIMMRRFSALSGSVFLLRCATMFITSLSVPGHHLDCAPREQSDYWTKLDQAWIIWYGGGLSIKGVRTCGDYMFSGHTTALTILNFFITEYTPRRMYFLHIASWVLNTFGIFFILAAHEHYSIDVFIAFYITSRMFLYYHSLANNRALQQRDSFRTKIWFPMFSYFEADIDGIVPNEYDNPVSYAHLEAYFNYVKGKADICKLFLQKHTATTQKPDLKKD